MSRWSIQAQITLLGGVLAVLLVGAVVAGGSYLATQRETVIAGELMSRLAGRMAHALDYGMFERFREIKLLAGAEPLRVVWTTTPDEGRPVLDAMQTSMPEYAWIGFAGPKGEVKVATGGLLEGRNVEERPWFQEGLKGPFVGDLHEAKLLASLLRSDTDEPLRFVDFAAPVHDERGALAGVVGAHLTWDWADAIRAPMLTPELRARQTELWILSPSGQVLLGPDEISGPFPAELFTRMKAARTGSITHELVGEDSFVGFAQTKGYRDYPGLGWIVVARQPTSFAFAAARGRALKLALIGTITSIIGLLLVATLGSRIGRPLRRLTQDADRIGRDPTASTLPRATGSHEIELLSGALRSLLRRSGDAEKRVHETEVKRVSELRQHSRDVDQLRRLADTDPLTGLLNRRAFDRSAEEAMQHFRRYGRSLAVLVVDVDHFKRINDEYGHAAGDDVIQHVARVLSRDRRVPDRVARLGGEEFVLLLHEIHGNDAAVIAERLRQEVEQSYICRDKVVIKATVSIGATSALPSDRDIEDVIARADAALYAAKNTGRNRVVFAATALEQNSVEAA